MSAVSFSLYKSSYLIPIDFSKYIFHCCIVFILKSCAWGSDLLLWFLLPPSVSHRTPFFFGLGLKLQSSQATSTSKIIHWTSRTLPLGHFLPGCQGLPTIIFIQCGASPGPTAAQSKCTLALCTVLGIWEILLIFLKNTMNLNEWVNLLTGAEDFSSPLKWLFFLEAQGWATSPSHPCDHVTMWFAAKQEERNSPVPLQA